MESCFLLLLHEHVHSESHDTAVVTAVPRIATGLDRTQPPDVGAHQSEPCRGSHTRDEIDD